MSREETTHSQPDSLLRRFSVLYVGFSLVPFVLLFYLYSNFDDNGSAVIVSKTRLTIIIVLVGIGALIGFLGMRMYLVKIIRLAENMKRSVMGKVDKGLVLELVKENGEIGELARSFSHIFTKLEDNISELEETRRTLRDVFAKVSRALSSVEDIDSLVKLILETAIEALGTSNGALFSLGEDGEFALKAWVGNSGHADENVLSEAASLLDWVKKERRLLVLPAVESKDTTPLFPPPLVCAPLISHDKLWGAVCLSGKRSGHNFTENEVDIISNLSHQVALSFQHVQLSSDMERTYFETMSALAMAVEARDPYSRGHSERVGIYAEKMGKAMGLDEVGLQTLRDSARLHDVGKIGITDMILRKPGPLTAEEREIMKKHPAIGETIVKPLKTFKHLLDPIRHHHEVLDGSGYPDGLRGEELTLLTRIMTVADIYDALTEDRPYRTAMSREETRKEFDGLVSQGKIDKKMVELLFSTID